MNDNDDLLSSLDQSDLTTLLAAWSQHMQLSNDESENIRLYVLEHRMDRHEYRMAVLHHRINRAVERLQWSGVKERWKMS